MESHEEGAVLVKAIHEMPDLWRPGLRSLSKSGRSQVLHDKEAPLPVVPIGFLVNSIRPRGPQSRSTPRRSRVEGVEGQRQTFRTHASITEADLIFRLDAARLGYLERPRGFSAYYRAFGMLPPRYLSEAIPRLEFTNFDMNHLVDRSRHIQASAEIEAVRSL